MATLVTRDLCKSYKGLNVVNNVNVGVKNGEVVGLLGPNGAGKTTTFYMICGLIRRDRGRITLDQKDISDLPMHKRARLGIGYLPQEPSVFRRLSVEDNIMAVLEALPSLNAAQRKHRVDVLLEEFNLTHKRRAKGISLSGGERRRVEIARALSLTPSFILLDEPFAGIDPISVKDIQKIISFLKQRGIGVLITDHNVRETLSITDRAYIINNGEILRAGPPDELSADPQVRKIYLGEDFRL